MHSRQLMPMQRRRSLPLALLLACALLGAQWLGGWHRVAHAPNASAALAAAASPDSFEHHHVQGDVHERHHGNDDGHGHEKGSADCRLLDHLLGALPIAAPPGATLPLVAPDSAYRLAAGLVPHAAAWRQPAARGPPVAA